jgi:hypothetical protein
MIRPIFHVFRQAHLARPMSVEVKSDRAPLEAAYRTLFQGSGFSVGTGMRLSASL